MNLKNTVTNCCAVIIVAVLSVFTVNADGYEVNYSAEAIFNAGNGDFAPYYVASNRHGVITQGKGAMLRIAAWRPMDMSRRFSYGFGVDAIGGYNSEVDYLRWNGGSFISHGENQSPVILQQLYGEVKYRGVFLTVGMKEHSSALLNQRLSSGDFIESGNARPIPEVRLGFNDFQNIPFTNGWVQIQGEIAYGKLTDNKWMRNHYNYYQLHMNQGALYSYKHCYFRTNPQKPFSATFGMQVGTFFGGTTEWYNRGELVQTRKFSSNLKSFFKMFVPVDRGLDYYSGSHLGSWDVMFRYNFRNGMVLKAYMQKPWEDGSGIGFLNGFDGLWGVELKTGRRGWLTGAVVEYLDFTNQSGAMHWDPDDYPGATIRGRAEGADDYYNNHEFNSYAHYGMAIGTPFLVSPIYNRDGSTRFIYNRMRGFHIGFEGEILNNLSYRVLGSYRKSWGSGYVPLVDPAQNTSVMLEGDYKVHGVNGLDIKAQLAFDCGDIYGNNFGACVTVAYRGAFKF